MAQSKCDPKIGRRSSLAALCIITIAVNSSYAAIAPILPLEFAQYATILSEQWMSLIFLAFSIGSSIAPPFVARRLEKIGTVTVVVLSMVGMGVMFWCLGHAFDLVASDEASAERSSGTKIVAVLALLQFFLGGFFSAITTGYYSAATTLFAENKESAMSFIECSVGTGYILGPIVGSAIYDWKGYQYAYTFISVGMIFMAFITWKLLAPCLTCTIPEVTDEDVSSDEEAPRRLFISYSSFESISSISTADREPLNVDGAAGVRQVSQHQPSTISLLKRPKIIFAATNILWINVAWTFLEPLLAKRLDNFQVGKKDIGIIFSLSNVVYVPTVFLMQYIPSRQGKKSSKNMWRHRIIWLSTMLTPMAVLLVGSNQFFLVITGIVLLGLLPTPVWVLLLPFMQEESQMLFPDPHLKQCVNDVSAGIYNSFMTLGQVVGYLIGPLMLSYGFAKTTYVVAMLIFLQSIMFFFFGVDRQRSAHISSKQAI